MMDKPLSEISSEMAQALSNSVLALTVSLEDLLNDGDTKRRFYRKYYMTPEPDGSFAFFRTTDEPEWTDDGYGKTEKLGETLTILSSFEAVIDDLNNDGLAKVIYHRIIGEPQYVYYEVDFMHDDLRPLFRNHLAGELWRFPDEHLLKELSGWELRQIEKWKKWVLPRKESNPYLDEQQVDTEPESSTDLYDRINNALLDARLIMSLQIVSFIHDSDQNVSQRLYFSSEMDDGAPIYFLNTNEVVNQREHEVNGKKLGSGWEDFFSIEDLIYDLNNFSAAADDHSSVHGPPKYVYYDILHMNDELKSHFQKHLDDDISGLDDQYIKTHFEAHDLARIQYWKTLLTRS